MHEKKTRQHLRAAFVLPGMKSEIIKNYDKVIRYAISVSQCYPFLLNAKQKRPDAFTDYIFFLHKNAIHAR